MVGPLRPALISKFAGLPFDIGPSQSGLPPVPVVGVMAERPALSYSNSMGVEGVKYPRSGVQTPMKSGMQVVLVELQLLPWAR